MMDLRSDHVGISVGDLEASIAWYRDMLGFSLERIVEVPEDSGMVGIMRHGDFLLELFCIPGATTLPDDRRYPWTDSAFVRDNTGNLVEFVERP